MSDTPWTKGPWMIDGLSEWLVRDHCGNRVASCSLGRDETLANANLIAAAPDMAEALAAFIAIDEDSDPTPQDRIDAAFAAARAVLVKARGGL